MLEGMVQVNAPVAHIEIPQGRRIPMHRNIKGALPSTVARVTSCALLMTV
jgi:hypothetical protein